MSPRAVDILGVRVDNVTTTSALAVMEAFVSDGGTHQVVTVNPEFVIRAQRDPAFHVVLDEADLALPDGYGLLWASRLLGTPLCERVAGSDLLPLLARLSAQRGYRMFLLGAAPGVAERTANILSGEYPSLQIAGTFSGSPAPEEEGDLIARIVPTSPDFLLVAYGAPEQDLWIHRNAAKLGVSVCMGVGGSFDFVAGIRRRAPLWMQERGLEWLYRLIQEPRRWRRMLALPQFVYRVVRQRIALANRS